jgi:SET domain-containing protein
MTHNARNDNEFVEIGGSGIHRHGAFARKDIKAGTRLIEYIGKKITKDESSAIVEESIRIHLEDPENNAATYIFELDDTWDVDGDVPENDARYINHSCEPNCQYEYADGKIWIKAIKDIQKGTELVYNYGFSIDDENEYEFKEHPCKCGSERCVGYILEEKQWPRMQELIEKEKVQNKHNQ